MKILKHPIVKVSKEESNFIESYNIVTGIKETYYHNINYFKRLGDNLYEVFNEDELPLSIIKILDPKPIYGVYFKTKDLNGNFGGEQLVFMARTRKKAKFLMLRHMHMILGDDLGSEWDIKEVKI